MTTTTPTHPLATFDDRWTIRHIRFFAAPIERVWRAVTTSEELNVWLLPVTRIDARLGGCASFTWGSPEHQAWVTEITVFEPPRVIRFSSPNLHGEIEPRGAHLQFELEPVAGGTRFTFIHHVLPEGRDDLVGLDRRGKDGQLPAGLDTPWKPGFVAGYHGFLDALGLFVSEPMPPERIATESARRVEIANGERQGDLRPEGWATLVEAYFDHLEKNCPTDARPTVPVDAETARPYVGRYEDERVPGFAFEVSMHETGLALTCGRRSHALTLKSDRHGVFEDPSWAFTFHRDAAGEVDGAVCNLGRGDVVLRKLGDEESLRPPIVVPSDVIERCVGRYGIPGFVEVAVVLGDDGHLTMRSERGALPLVPRSERSFVAMGSPRSYEFALDGDAPAARLTATPPGVTLARMK